MLVDGLLEEVNQSVTIGQTEVRALLVCTAFVTRHYRFRGSELVYSRLRKEHFREHLVGAGQQFVVNLVEAISVVWGCFRLENAIGLLIHDAEIVEAIFAQKDSRAVGLFVDIPSSKQLGIVEVQLYLLGAVRFSCQPVPYLII